MGLLVDSQTASMASRVFHLFEKYSLDADKNELYEFFLRHPCSTRFINPFHSSTVFDPEKIERQLRRGFNP